jgi:hypothetical protein
MAILMAVKRDKYDRIFSDIVRERADHTCEHCGKYEGKTQSCHCAHIHGRASRATRWCADNVICLCASCHFNFGTHPTEFTNWLREYLGQGYLDVLSERAHSIKKWTKHDKEEMYKHYKDEYKIMMKARNNGVEGRITFLNYGF